MHQDTMKPYGMALLDYHRGDKSAAVTIIRDDGLITPLPASAFFRRAQDYELESIALEKAFGKVLDVGAGTGLHSIFLQEKGLTVCAIDISPEAIQIMHERGVADVRRADIMSFKGGKFNSIIMMGHGIGIVENLSGLDRFLRRVRALLEPGGQILLESLDVRGTNDPDHLSYQRKNAEAGRYIGEVRMQFKYVDQTGQFFGWLYFDPDILAEHASTSGWHCEVIHKQDDGNYLARLYLDN